MSARVRYSAVMRIAIVILSVFFSATLMAATVYKTVDENGNVVFTDKSSDDAEQIQLDDLQTIKNPNTRTYRPLPPKPEPMTESDFYQEFSIITPIVGEAYRNNAGNFTISFSLRPGLETGHRVLIMLNGKEVSGETALSVSLTGQERGMHSITAKVVNNQGKTLISTAGSFTLLRAVR